MQTGMLCCLNKKCNFTVKPMHILWTCSSCGKEFKSNAIPYNPLEVILIKKVIRHTLLLKHRAHPYKIQCCDLNVYFTDFYHKKICRGTLFEGELNDKMIIVCDKCHAINFHERFIWTCPKCGKKFRDRINLISEEQYEKHKNKGIMPEA
jgi:ribosomal protein L37AE/L43A